MTRRSVGSLLPLGNGRFRVRIGSGTDPATGERRVLQRTVSGGRLAAEQALAALLVEAQLPPTATMTLRSYVEGVWIPSLRLRERTIDGYKCKMNQQVLPYLGDLSLADVDPYALDSWLARLSDLKLSDRTRQHAYRVLHAALGRAVKLRLLPANPLDAVDAPRVERKTPEVLTAVEARAYIAAFRGHLLEAHVLVTLDCGLRRSEAAALKWSDIDFSAGTVDISRGLHQAHGKVWTEPPKTVKSRRVVDLSPPILARLKELRGIGPLTSENGATVSPDRITELYRRHLAKCELRKIPLKNLRHTNATRLLEAGVPLWVVSQRLGHSSQATTDAFYLAPGRERMAEAAQTLGAVWEPPKADTDPQIASQEH